MRNLLKITLLFLVSFQAAYVSSQGVSGVDILSQPQSTIPGILDRMERLAYQYNGRMVSRTPLSIETEGVFSSARVRNRMIFTVENGFITKSDGSVSYYSNEQSELNKMFNQFVSAAESSMKDSYGSGYRKISEGHYTGSNSRTFGTIDIVMYNGVVIQRIQFQAK